MRALRPVLILLLIALALAGCLEQPGDALDTPTDPAAMLQTRTVNRGFMPMTPGNHWRYDRVVTIAIVPEDGSAPEPPMTEYSHIDIDHVEHREIGEYQYVLEREIYSDETGANERLLRQDRAGYYIFQRPKNNGKTSERPVLSSAMRTTAQRIAERYGADLSRVDALRRVMRGLDVAPDASPPGGALAGELQQLAYPLHVGTSWTILDSPLLVATVEGREQFRGFSAWRVRIEGDFIYPNDRFHIWYSRCGEVGRRLHAEVFVTNPDGTPLGIALVDEYVDIIALDVDRDGCDIAPGRGGDGGVKGVLSYPIAIGNRWVYESTLTEQTRNDPPIVTTSTVIDVQEAWEQIQGREYMRQVTRTLGVTPAFAVQYVRQDRDGLYQMQTAVPGSRRVGFGPLLARLIPRVSTGPETGELTLLSYPLKVGTSWTIIDFGDGAVTATVDARERLSTPAGEFDTFRVRIRNPFQNEGDEAFVWYGREGVVKSYVRATLGGDSRVEEVWVLQELDLAE